MAKVDGPLLSASAQKTFAGRLEYSKRRGKNFVRNHQQPSGEASSSQSDIRGYFLEATQKWALLSAGDKQDWTDYNNS